MNKPRIVYQTILPLLIASITLLGCNKTPEGELLAVNTPSNHPTSACTRPGYARANRGSTRIELDFWRRWFHAPARRVMRNR